MATSSGFSVPGTAELREAHAAQLASGTPTIQRCSTCCHLHHPPRVCCPECLGEAQELVAFKGGGVVHTMIWYWQPIDPRYDTVPYNVALVELDEGPLLVTTIRGLEPGADAIGARVVARVDTSAHSAQPAVTFDVEP